MTRLLSQQIEGKECISVEFKILRHFISKVRGLLGTAKNTSPVALMKCKSIHTFAMCYAIDVAFLSKELIVLRTYLNVAPGKILSCSHAYCTLERPHSSEPWFEVNRRIEGLNL